MPRSTSATEPTQASKPPRADLLTVTVQNFGPIAQAEVNLRPLTILVGRTNTGKTCFSKLIYAIHKTLSGFPLIPYFGCDYDLLGSRDSVDLLLSGLGKCSETECHKQEIRNHVSRCFELNRYYGNDQILKEIGLCFGATDISTIRRARSRRKDFKIDILNPEAATDIWNISIGLKQSKASVDAKFDPNAIEFANSTYESIVSEIERHIDLATLINDKGTMDLDPLEIEHSLLDLAYPDSGNRQNSYYLPANRAGILESHRFIADAWSGHTPSYGLRVSSVLRSFPRVSVDFIRTMTMGDNRPQAYMRKPAPSGIHALEEVAKFMEDELIGGKLQTKTSTETAFPVFEYVPSHTKRPLRLDAASSMISELAPIIVIARSHLAPFDLLIIEEPEAHLHPGELPLIAKCLEEVAKFMEDELIGGKLQTKTSTETAFPVFEYVPSHTKRPLRLDAASSMISELAPIIVIARSHLAPFDLLIIEEPEAHLHPGELPLIAKCLAKFVRSNVRVLISTHSDWLLKSLRNLILDGDLIQPGLPGQNSADDDYLLRNEVGAWEFTASNDLGGTTVDEIEFDELDGIEPLEFERLSDQLYNESVAIRNAKARGLRQDIE